MSDQNTHNHKYAMNRIIPGNLIIETQCAYCAQSIITVRGTEIYNAGRTSEPACKTCSIKEAQEHPYDEETMEPPKEGETS